jgi:hypothetical protein
MERVIRGSKGVAATTDWGGQRMCKIQSVNSAATNESPHQNFEKKGGKGGTKRWKKIVKERNNERKKYKRKKEKKKERKREVRNNKNANYVLLDSVQTLYHGVLYFQNVIKFHGTGVRELRFNPCVEFRGTHKCLPAL